MTFKWSVEFGGGIGPNEWRNEIIVFGYNITDALSKAKKALDEIDYEWISSISDLENERDS